MRSWLPACLLISALACREQPRDDATPASARAEPAAEGSEGSEGSEDSERAEKSGAAPLAGDPFATIEALRPEPWTGWPLENVDLQGETGWRIDPVSGKFELERGLSFTAEAQAFVLAIAPGKVFEVSRDAQGEGLEIAIDHGEGIESRYAPLADALVHAGLPVTRGAAIGLAQGKSLRLLVTVDGVAIDPLLVLRQPLHRWPALLRGGSPGPGPGP